MGTSEGTVGVVPDVGDMPDFTDGTPVGCKGKIDFVFSISSRKYMETEQTQLLASFEGFVKTIEARFADFDYHILVANTGGYHQFMGCEPCAVDCPETSPDYPCDATFDACDDVYGAGVTFPNGWNATNHRCALAGGHRYMIGDDINPVAAFQCIAQVGTGGTDLVVQSALAALSPELEACNAGFLREDALLVVTLIADADDSFSKDQPPDWTQGLLDAKGGDPDASVVLIVMNDAYLADGLCKPYQPGTYRLVEWSKQLPHVRMGSTCADTYVPFFEEAVGLIEEQCEVFVPQ
jgi:hypothetical protein